MIYNYYLLFLLLEFLLIKVLDSTPAKLREALRFVGLPDDISKVVGRSFVFEVPIQRPEVPDEEAERDRFIFGSIVGGRLNSEGFLSLFTNIMDIRGDKHDAPSVGTPIVLVVSVMSHVGGKRRRVNAHWAMLISTHADEGGDGIIPGTLSLL